MNASGSAGLTPNFRSRVWMTTSGRYVVAQSVIGPVWSKYQEPVFTPGALVPKRRKAPVGSSMSSTVTISLRAICTASRPRSMITCVGVSRYSRFAALRSVPASSSTTKTVTPAEMPKTAQSTPRFRGLGGRKIKALSPWAW